MASNAGQESSNRISSESADNINTSKKLAVNPDEKEIGADNSKEEPLSIINAVPISSDVKQVVAPNTTPTTVASQLVSTGATGQLNVSRPLNIYAPPPQAHSFYYGGYNNVSSSEWDKNVQYLNQEGIEPGSNSTYSENPLMFHTGYGFSPSGAYGGPYSPVTTPLPSAGSDGQLYSPQQYSITGHYYQQPLPPSLSFLNSPTPVSQGDFAMPAGVEHRGSFLPDPPNSNGALFEPKPNYTSHGTFGRNSYSGNPGYYDFRQGFDGFVSSGSWPDWSNATDTQNNIMSFYSPADSPQPISTHGSFGHNVDPFASRLAPQQQNSFYGYGSSINTLDRGYSHGGLYRGTNFGENGQNWIGNDKGTRRGKGDTPPYSFNGIPDFLSEQSRGPRATKPKSSETEPYSQIDGRNRNSSTATVNSELYNQPDFTVEHKDARFFVIKSYSEDNVHKSIKYGLWASTPNGNRKLDTAYREAKEKGGACPVFLFFSVNSSAQFCGVAEMIGNVDFNKSVDYWQQDKWSGNFPVKWHIVKDVPNSMFRHIILENNDKKPVTNSRDTQEIKLKQGLEMLNIFKEHESSMSILEDFDFYEEREKAMKERKALHKQQQQSTTMPSHLVTSSSSEHQRPSLLSSVYKVNQMAEDFVHAVRLDEISTENTSATAESSSIVCAEKTKAEHSTNTSSITDSK